MPLKKSWFVLSTKKPKLEEFSDSQVRFTASLAKKFITTYTKKSDIVFDPFAGFGTTILAAKSLGRVGYGIEFEKDKVDWLERKLKPPHKIIHGSSLDIKKLNLPKMDLVLGSPPYMRYFDKENPLSAYTKRGSYKNYLKGIGKIYSDIKKITKKNAPIVIEIENTFDQRHPATPLAWDVGKEVSKHLQFERDFIQCFKEGRLDKSWSNNNHSYCLLFRNS